VSHDRETSVQFSLLPVFLSFFTFLYFQLLGSAALQDIVRVLDRVYDAEQAEQGYSNSDAGSNADTDSPPDYVDLEDEGSGADGEAAEDRRPLIFIPQGFFSDDVSHWHDGCYLCL
jgi:hypothetical protein